MRWEAVFVERLWRYPVKSMLGEELREAFISEAGLSGDRSYALLDVESGMVASAKNPKLYDRLLMARASLEDGQLKIYLPSGRVLVGENLDDDISRYLGRRVRLISRPAGSLEYLSYWPRVEELEHKNEYEVGATLAETFYDAAPIHIITVRDLETLAHHAPSSNVEPQRFRPNILVNSHEGFSEDGLLGRLIQLGEAIIRVTRRTRRCIVTTLSQPSLPSDLNILRTIYRSGGGFLGLYASVAKPGIVRVGDALEVL